MNGSQQGGQKIEARSQMRPEPGNMLKPVHAFLLAKSRSDASVVSDFVKPLSDPDGHPLPVGWARGMRRGSEFFRASSCASMCYRPNVNPKIKGFGFSDIEEIVEGFLL